jgi:hypothetical protein
LIINILNDSFLEDLNSTNGTYVNGKLIKKHALQHGDVVTVGHHQLRFVDTQSSDTEPDEFEKTMVITPGSAVAAAAAKKASAIAPPPPPAPRSSGATATAIRAVPSSSATGEHPVALPKAKLQVLSGAFAGRELELNKALTTLGRPGVQVAAITRRADGFFIVHVDSGKPNDYPHVNGSGIGEQARQVAGQRCDPARGREDGILRGLKSVGLKPPYSLLTRSAIRQNNSYEIVSANGATRSAGKPFPHSVTSSPTAASGRSVASSIVMSIETRPTIGASRPLINAGAPARMQRG